MATEATKQGLPWTQETPLCVAAALHAIPRWGVGSNGVRGRGGPGTLRGRGHRGRMGKPSLLLLPPASLGALPTWLRPAEER